jgi:hypothetical protein
MNAIIQTILVMLAKVAPLIQDSAAIASIINTLEELIPVIVQEYKDLVQPVKNIIAALSANPATTADQLTTLQTLDAQADADFDAAAAAFTANHPAGA